MLIQCPGSKVGHCIGKRESQHLFSPVVSSAAWKTLISMAFQDCAVLGDLGNSPPGRKSPSFLGSASLEFALVLGHHAHKWL